MNTTRYPLPLPLIRSLAWQGLADAELLRRYADDQDQDAFAELVRRNGPVVFRACRHVLRETSAAEDAFQATFLVLARRARRLTATGSLAGWLHTVAVRTARDARRADLRRRRREQARETPTSTSAADDLTWREVRQRLDVELAALPEQYRTALALCYLQELSYEEAARRAGCSVGELRGRLQRGKELLRKRLARRGLALGVPALVLGAPAAVSAALTEQTLAVVRTGLGHGTLPPGIAGIVGRMAGRRAMVVLAVVLAAIAIASAAVALSTSAPGEPPIEDIAPAAFQAAAAPEPGTDRHGDPLPAGAVMRLGTRRFQVETNPLSVRGGKAYLVYLPESSWNTGTYYWLDATTGKVIDRFHLPMHRRLVCVSADGRLALITEVNVNYRSFSGYGAGLKKGAFQGTFAWRVFDLDQKKEIKTLQGRCADGEGDATPSAGEFSADRKWLATVGFTGPLPAVTRLWNLENGKLAWQSTKEMAGGQTLVPVGFSPGNRLLILRGSKNHSIHVLDVGRGKLVRSFAISFGDRCSHVQLAPDGLAVLLATPSRQILSWDLQSGKARPPLAGHQSEIRGLGFTPDGKALFSGDAAGLVLVRDWPSGEIRRRFRLGREGIQSLFLSADGRILTAVVSGENMLRRYDFATGQPLPVPGETHRNAVIGVAATPDGDVISLGRDGSLRTWDPATGRQTLATLRPVVKSGVSSVPLGADGKHIAYVSTGFQSKIQIRGHDGGKLLRTLEAGKRGPDGVVFSPDGRFLARSGPENSVVQVWDVAGGRLVKTFSVAKSGWWSGGPYFTFSPDGRYFVATTAGRLQFWEVDGWQAVEGLPEEASGLAFSPDGRLLACGNLYKVNIWEVATRKMRASFKALGTATREPRFSPDGRYLTWINVTAGPEVWDVYRAERLVTVHGHDEVVNDVAFTADSRRLVTASADCTLLVWDVAGLAGRLKAIAPPSDKDLTAAWEGLGSTEGAKAFAAIRTLLATPDRSVAFLAGRLRPAAPPDAAELRRLLRDLDSPRFAIREQATLKLKALGDAVAAPLRKFLAGNPPPEAQRRAEQLLEAVTGPVYSPGFFQQLRGVEVLERLGTTSARALLRQLAQGNADAGLTHDAARALRRLASQN